jgi:kynureninase
MSNPPILSMAAIRASLDLFDKAGMASLRQKSEKLTAYLFFLVNHLEDEAIRVITPEKPGERGCQVSLQMLQPNKDLFAYLTNEGVVADWREPDVIRVAPVPFYNTFQDVWHFYTILKKGLTTLH